MSESEIGPLVRSIPVPPQTNDPDITVASLDLHANGFVVRCKIGQRQSLGPVGFASLDLRDSLGTRFEHAGHGEDFVAYTPAIPPEAEWVKVYTRPETHIDLV
jgi:hypothetical protein